VREAAAVRPNSEGEGKGEGPLQARMVVRRETQTCALRQSLQPSFSNGFPRRGRHSLGKSRKGMDGSSIQEDDNLVA